MNPHFVLTSRWRLDTGAPAVWALLTDIEAWPRWWRHVRRVRVLERAPGSPLGDVAQIDWSGALLYGTRLRMVTAVAERPRMLEGHASGDLRGVGAWILEPTPDGGVDVTYRWEVELHRRSLRHWIALLTPAFEWNHFVVMRAGARGMAHALGCRLSHAGEWSSHRRA
jgi:Polyketide cyclase / dehydrase and lipid transport